jgi:hypothetical protein
MADENDRNGQLGGMPDAWVQHPDLTPLSGKELVQRVLAVGGDDDDPRTDRRRLCDPQAHDTDPRGPKANYITGN